MNPAARDGRLWWSELLRGYLGTGILLTLALAASAQERDPEKVLAQARDRILDRTEHLPNYTCVETVDRKYLRRAKPEIPTPSCDRLSAERSRKAGIMKVEATDRLRLDVKVSAGNEIGSWAGASRFEDEDMVQLVKGPFGTGPFGTFLSDIFTIPAVTFYFLSEEGTGGATLFRYRFQVPKESSHYMVQAGGDWRVTGYDGVIEIDPNSLELRRLEVRTSELPEETGACEANTTVEYASVLLGTGEFLLPQRSTLDFLMRDTSENEISTSYAGCRKFVGKSKLVLQQEQADVEKPHTTPGRTSIPAGLAISLTLADGIDTDKAAAGDEVAATVEKAVFDERSGAVIIPGGAKARFRIVRVEHWMNSPRYFLVALIPETVEFNGSVFPFNAIPKHGEEETAKKKSFGHPIVLRAPGESRFTGTFTFTTEAQHHVMPRGYEMQWITAQGP